MCEVQKESGINWDRARVNSRLAFTRAINKLDGYIGEVVCYAFAAAPNPKRPLKAIDQRLARKANIRIYICTYIEESRGFPRVIVALYSYTFCRSLAREKLRIALNRAK